MDIEGGYRSAGTLNFKKIKRGSKGGRTNVDIEARVRVPRA